MTELRVEGLSVEVNRSEAAIVEEITFTLQGGEIVALVGESGSGKTTIGTALMGDSRTGARISGGEIHIGEDQVVPAGPVALDDIRGRRIAYIPQDPTASLNPAIRIGRQLSEILKIHEFTGDQKARMAELMADVGLPSTPEFQRRYPHQLSGGQQQRVCMAIAIACSPDVLVLDEPTTGLDVTTQAHVLGTIRALVEGKGISALYVTHDLSVVAHLAQRIMVLYAGKVVEEGPREEVFRTPRHPYTARLIAAIPDAKRPRPLVPIDGHAPRVDQRPSGCSFAPRCEFVTDRCREIDPPITPVGPNRTVRCLRAKELVVEQRPSADSESATRTANNSPLIEVEGVSVAREGRSILRDVDLTVYEGECLALVGESGSGKTTLARAVLGMVPQRSGVVRFNGSELPLSQTDLPAEVRRQIQYIFQSPFNSLNPRRTVAASLEMPVRHFFGEDRRAVQARAKVALEKVSMPVDALACYPSELSGGERQRVSIARAIACEPTCLLCDEVTSALDVSVQASIVELLLSLRETENLTLLFITHNLALVRSMADRMVVLQDGRIVEDGLVDVVMTAPENEYTQSLIENTLDIDEAPLLTLA